MELQKLPLGSFILKNHQTDRSMPTMYIVLIHQSSHSEAKDTLCCNKCGRNGSPGQRTSDCHPEWHVLVLVLPSLQGDESGKPCPCPCPPFSAGGMKVVVLVLVLLLCRG